MPKRPVIMGIGYAVPERILTNADLEGMVDTTDDWITSRTGIKERRICSEGEDTSVLCIRAAQQALERSGISAREIDLIVTGTVTGETNFPSTACRIQHGIGANGCTAMDIMAACAGFVYGGAVASAFFAAGTHKTALVVGAEVLSKITDYDDRGTCVLFGDGAGAAVLRAEEGERGILASVLRADGAGAELIRLAFEKPRKPIGGGAPFHTEGAIYMEGQEVFRFAVKAIADACLECLELAGVRSADVDMFVPHQANLRIIRSSMERLGLDDNRVFLNIDRYGNTSSASIPIALCEAERSGRIRQGDLVLTVGFGAGLTWGANLIRW